MPILRFSRSPETLLGTTEVQVAGAPGVSMDEPQPLLDLMTSHLAGLESASTDNEFVDVAEARRLHDLIRVALERWDELDAPRRKILSDAVTYLIRTDDEEDDLRSPIGLEDDTAVVEAALRRIMRP